MKITNTSKAPAGIHTHQGLKFVEPDESIEADVTGAELESAKASGLFDFSGKAKEIAKPAPTLPVEPPAA